MLFASKVVQLTRDTRLYAAPSLFLSLSLLVSPGSLCAICGTRVTSQRRLAKIRRPAVPATSLYSPAKQEHTQRVNYVLPAHPRFLYMDNKPSHFARVPSYTALFSIRFNKERKLFYAESREQKKN